MSKLNTVFRTLNIAAIVAFSGFLIIDFLAHDWSGMIIDILVIMANLYSMPPKSYE
jgi:hypothetical protein